MKKLLKVPIKAFWRMTGPVRRPFVRKFEAMVARGCASINDTHICPVNEETTLVMDHLVRELVRLQGKVDRLLEAIEDLTPDSSGLVVLCRNEDESLRSAG